MSCIMVYGIDSTRLGRPRVLGSLESEEMKREKMKSKSVGVGLSH